LVCVSEVPGCRCLLEQQQQLLLLVVPLQQRYKVLSA
jgi:hypothetical protein